MKRFLAGASVTILLTEYAMAQSALSTAEFVQKVALSDMLEIQSSQLIAPNADADTKPFAEKMIKDHTKTSTELKGLVQGGKVKAEIPTKLDAEHQAKLDRLKKLSGKEL